jgi:hypothetical protein
LKSLGLIKITSILETVAGDVNSNESVSKKNLTFVPN